MNPDKKALVILRRGGALLCVLTLALFSCTPKYDNPIDPENPGALPPTPRALRVISVQNERSMQVIFDYDYANASGIIIERAESPAGTFAPVDTVYPPATSRLDTNGTRDTTAYDYRIRAFNSSGVSGYSDAASGRTGLFIPGDASGPMIAIFNDGNPIAGYKTVKDSNLVLNGTILDASGVKTFTVNGAPVAHDSLGRWSFSQVLRVFTNRFAFVAVDSAPSANVTRDTIVIYYDFPNPPRIVSPRLMNISLTADSLSLGWRPCTDIDFKGFAVWLAQGVPVDTGTPPSIMLTSGVDTAAAFKVDSTGTYYFVVAVADSSGNFVFDRNSTGHIRSGLIYRGNMVRVNPGTFFDGTNHAAVIRPFYMDTTEVSQAMFANLGENFSNWPGENLPLTDISWYQAVLILNKMSKQEGFDTAYTYDYIRGDTAINLVCRWNVSGYRLPSEDEWEYACSAGTSTRFYWGDNDSDAAVIGRYAWFSSNCMDSSVTPPAPRGPQPVGTLLPNAWGLYDMAGSIYELCWDWYGSAVQRLDGRSDYSGPASPSQQGKVIKGGWWQSNVTDLGSGYRFYQYPTRRSSATGLRRALTIN